MGFPHFSIQNLLGPLLPRNAANPSYGTLDVPVTNCKSRRRLSLSNFSIACQNHWMTGWLSWYPVQKSMTICILYFNIKWKQNFRQLYQYVTNTHIFFFLTGKVAPDEFKSSYLIHTFCSNSSFVTTLS